VPQELLIPTELAQSADPLNHRIHDFVRQFKRLELAELRALLLVQLKVLKMRFLCDFLARREREARRVLSQEVLRIGLDKSLAKLKLVSVVKLSVFRLFRVTSVDLVVGFFLTVLVHFNPAG
jgi:hypothetical protein